MTERNRKAVVAEDGGSIEVYSEGRRYVIALGFSVWDWIELVKNGGNLPKRTSLPAPRTKADQAKTEIAELVAKTAGDGR